MQKYITTITIPLHLQGEKGEPGVTIAADGSLLSAPKGPQGPKGIKVPDKRSLTPIWPYLTQ